MKVVTGLVADLFKPQYRKYRVVAAGFVLGVLTLLAPDVPAQDKLYIDAAIMLLSALGVKAFANAPPSISAPK
jgi:hypothetical protein